MQSASKKQQQLATLIQEELSSIFIQLNLQIIDSKMVSISNVKMTPDLLEARIYISIYPFENEKDILERIKKNGWELKKKLVEMIKNNVRRIPVLNFYIDDTLDHMYKMETLFQKIK